MKKILAIYCCCIGLSAIVDGETIPSINAGKMKTMPVIDGKIEQMEWRDAARIDSFNLFASQRTEQNRPTSKTEAWTGYDNDNLYIAFKCFKNNIKNIKADEKNRDGEICQDDSVEIFLNTNPDEKDYYQFTVNAIGTQGDAFVRGSSAKIEKWDNSDWQASSFIGDNFWSAELVIPFKILKMTNLKSWRLNLARNDIFPLREHITWAPIKSISGWHQPEQFGYLSPLDIPDYNSVQIVDFNLGKKLIGDNVFSITLKNNTDKEQNIRVDFQIGDFEKIIAQSDKSIIIKAYLQDTISIPYPILQRREYNYKFYLSYLHGNKTFYTFSEAIPSIEPFSVILPVAFYSDEPVTTYCTINLSNKLMTESFLQINIFDSAGKLQKELIISELSARKEICLPQFEPGNYLLIFNLMDKRREIIASIRKPLSIIKNYMQK